MNDRGIGDARSWARVLHTGQSRIGGATYITHVTRVARLVEQAGGDDEQVQAAWLHDVAEDTPCSLDHLRRAGFSDRVVAMVDALTRRDRVTVVDKGVLVRVEVMNPETYWHYVERCGENADARLVKRADLLDNAFDDPRSGMLKRYARSLRVIAPELFTDQEAAR